MGGFLSPSPATSTQSGTSSTNYNPSQYYQNLWGDVTGTMAGLTIGPGGVVNNYLYPGQMVAQPSDLTTQYWGQAGGVGGLAGYNGALQQYTGDIQSAMLEAGGQLAATQRDPNAINLPTYDASSFQPGQLNLPSFGNIPNVTAPQGPSGLASSYLVNPGQVKAPTAYTPQQISAERVAAPGAVNPITGVPNVSAPTLERYQMGPAQQVSGPSLRDLSMQAAANVAPSGLATTQSWTDPGVAAQYMSPYTQQVVNAQLAQAQTQEQQQLAQQGAQAAQAGAFGGSRQAVEAANTSIGYQQLAAQLEAQGLQSAYQQGAQQFNQQQQLGQQAQQFNISSGLQAALANQQAQQQANVQNLSAALQTQGLQAQTGLQAALANQQAGLTVGGQNLGALLQTQQLGATTGLQAALANQSMSYQTQLANQQAQEFGYGQQLQAALANQQAGLTAAQANQAAGLQAGLANMQYQYGASQANAANALQAGLAANQLGLQAGMFNAGNQQQAALANQAAAMQGLGMTYQGGLQGALQTQNLGLQGALAGGQMGLLSAAQQQQLQQAQQNLNMGAISGAAGLGQAAANLGLTGYQTQLQGLGAVQQAATSQQGYQQQLADAAYQQWMNSMAMPIQATMALGQLYGMQPYQTPYTTTNTFYNTGTSTPYQPSVLSQLVPGIVGGLGTIGKIFGLREGGLVDRAKPTGLAAISRRRVPQQHGLAMVA